MPGDMSTYSVLPHYPNSPMTDLVDMTLGANDRCLGIRTRGGGNGSLAQSFFFLSWPQPLAPWTGQNQYISLLREEAISLKLFEVLFNLFYGIRLLSFVINY